VAGKLVDALEEIEKFPPELDQSRRQFYTAVYTYDLPDGRRLMGRQEVDPVDHRQIQGARSIQVRYLLDHPEVSQIVGIGVESLGGWIVRSAASLAALILSLLPGLLLTSLVLLGRRDTPGWWSRRPTIYDLQG
jgi:hypothetical protein